MIKKNIKMNKGISIIETLFYLVLFVMLSIVVINAMLTMMRSFKTTAIQRELSQSGTIMEAMSREIKKAVSINLITATDLVVNTKDDSGNSKLVEFVLSGTDLLYKENSTLTGNLNSANISVSNLTFTQINTAKSQAVKIVFSVQAKEDQTNHLEKYYDTVVLRGGY